MALPLAQAGHGALIAIELSNVTPGVFTTVAELNGDIKFPGLNRKETEVTPHQATIDEYILGVLNRDPLTFSMNFVFDDETHSFESGLYQKIVTNEYFGIRLRGPGGSSGTDEWIMSGQVQAINQTSPVRTGARTCDVTIRMSGPMIIDGVIVGAEVNE